MCNCSGGCSSGCSQCVPKGESGRGIVNIVENGDGTATITYTDATTQDITLPVGPAGADGADGADGTSSYETFIDLSSPGSFGGAEGLIPGATYTFPEDGNYQINISVSLFLRTASPSAETILNWYLDAVEQQSKVIINTAATTDIQNVFPTFVWRGAVTAGQVLEVRGILGTGSAQCTVDELSILINKEV